MSDFLKYDEYIQITEGDEKPKKETKKAAEPKPDKNCGQPLDMTFRDEQDYKKMLDFLRGKSNIKPEPPKGVAKGYFIANEDGLGVWVDGGWSRDEALLSKAVVVSEEKAKEIAALVGGIVIEAEKVL